MGSGSLSKLVKEQVVKSALRDVYKKQAEALFKEVQQKVNEAVAKDWEKFDWEHVEPYRKYMNWKDSVQFYHILPSAWSFDNFGEIVSSYLGLIWCGYISFNKGYPSVLYEGVNLSSSAKKKIVEAYKPLYDLLTKVREAKRELAAVLESVNTANQLAELLPEYVKYLPDPVSKSFLPVPVEKVAWARQFLSKAEVVKAG